MGKVHLGIPSALALALKKHFPIRTFVETGTYMGSTALWAASHFEQVITIENSQQIYEQTLATHGHIANIQFLFGNSKDVLKQVIPTIESPTLFWLDGHWSGGITYGKDDQCPLLEEITILNTSPINHFLLIDDARLYTSPPNRPCVIAEWPTIDQVIETIKAGPHEKYIAIFDDVILAFPKAAQEPIAEWLQEANTVSAMEWQKELQIAQSGRLRRGAHLIKEGLQLVTESALAKLQRMRQ